MRYTQEQIDKILEIGRRDKSNVDFSEAGVSSKTGITICRQNGVEIDPIHINGFTPPIVWREGYFEILCDIRYGSITVEEGQEKLHEIGVSASISAIKYKVRDEILEIDKLLDTEKYPWKKIKNTKFIVSSTGRVRTLWRDLKGTGGVYRLTFVDSEGKEYKKRVSREKLIIEYFM